MKLNQIKALIAIAETGSIRAAARKIGLTQPALSKNLQALEEELNVRLVHRTARGVNLTTFGQTILTRGRGIAIEFERLREEIEQMRGAQNGTLSIAMSPSPAMLLLPPAMTRFRQAFPSIQVSLCDGVYPKTLQLLREGLVDMSVGAHPPLAKSTLSEFQVETLYENKLVVTCRKGHPRANAKSLTELLDCEWLIHGPTEGPSSLHTPAFRANGIPLPNPVVVSESFISSLSLLENSDVLCVLPERLIAHLSLAGRLTALKLHEPMPDWDVSLITRVQSPLTPIAKKMVEIFRRTRPMSFV